MTEKQHYTRLCAVYGDSRLDRFLAQALPQVSRAALARAIADGGVLLDGRPCLRAAQKIAARGEAAVSRAALAAALPAGDDCAPEPIPLDIVHEDDCLLVINKPAGLVTHPGHGNREGTLQAGLLHHHGAAAGLARAGIVHRLDKDTSGLLVAAKSAAAQAHLTAQFKTRSIGREYLALVHGAPPATGLIDRPLRRHRHDALRMAVATGGREAITYFARERQWRGFALLRCKLQTGRTHQIRAHLEHYGFPVAGDKVYKRRAAPLPFAAPRQMLHAETLHLQHPQDNAPHRWHTPPPQDMQAAVEALDSLNSSQ